MKFLKLFILSLFLADTVWADVAVDAVTSVYATPGALSHSFSHTCSGSSRVLYVWARTRNTSNRSSTAVSYASVAMTKIASTVNLAGDIYQELWRLIAPATGSNTVQVTINGTSVTRTVLSAISFTGAHQTTPEGTIVKNETTGTSSSLNVTVAAGGMAMDSLVVQGGTVTPTLGAGQTSRFGPHANALCEATTDVVGSTEGGSGTVAMSWTAIDNFYYFSHIAVPIGPAATTAVAPISLLRRGRQ
jgi:hypothetical protein